MKPHDVGEDRFDEIRCNNQYPDVDIPKAHLAQRVPQLGLRSSRIAAILQRIFTKNNSLHQLEKDSEQNACRAIAESGLFDGDFYLDNYPDVAAEGWDPIMHFCRHGWKEGRNPCPEFNVNQYLEMYADVGDADINPFVHWLVHGRAEGREGTYPVSFNVDSTNGHEITGWIRRPQSPHERVIVELLLGDRVIAEATANQYREDLLKAGLGDGNYGFAMHFPNELRDGKAYKFSLRIKRSLMPFHEMSAFRLAAPRYLFDKCTPFEVVGSCWIPQNALAEITIDIFLAGTLVFSSQTDDLNGFSYLIGLDAFLPLLEGTAPGQTSGADLVVKANGLEIRKEHYNISLTDTEKFAVSVIEETSERFYIQLLSLDGGSEVVSIYLDDHVLYRGRNDLVRDVNIEFGSLEVSDGEHEITITSMNSGDQEVIQFSRKILYSRWELNIYIEDDFVVGDVVDNWSNVREPAIELLIDGRAVGITTAKMSADVFERKCKFEFPIALRFRDGKIHRIDARIIGTDALWPKRGLLFKNNVPAKNSLSRVECSSNGVITGFAVAPWAPEVILEVELRAGNQLLESRKADAPSPLLAAEQMLPENRGFSFDRQLEPNAALQVVGKHLGEELFNIEITRPDRNQFCPIDPGYAHEGACFVINDPYLSVENLEEARSILLAATDFSRSSMPVTIMLAWQGASEQRYRSIEPMLLDLIGSGNAQVLSRAKFVYLPAPVLASTCVGAPFVSYCLDLWVRACQFSLVLGPGRRGLMAYCGQSRREGLISDRTQIAIIVDGFVVEDLLDSEHLVDDPGLLEIEALERLALKTADHLLAYRQGAIEAGSRLWPQAQAKAVMLTAEAGLLPPTRLGRHPNPNITWLIMVGPLSVAAGVGVLCDAFDKIARQMGSSAGNLGLVFVGPEGNIRSVPAGNYIRERAKKWPFNLVINPNLTFDSVAQVVGDYTDVGVGLVLNGNECSVWADLITEAGLPVLDLDLSEKANPSTLARRLMDILAAPRYVALASTVKPSIGDHLQAIVATRTAKPSDVGSADMPELSVCITHFNRPTLVRQTLSSLRACKYPKLETIVIDDGSLNYGVREELAEIVKEFQDIGLKVVLQNNSYLGAARNTAARHAKGEFIIFMDDDNLAHPRMLDGFIGAQRATNADIVTSRFAFFNETDDIEPAFTIPERLGVPLTPDLAVGVFSNCFGDANMLVRRTAFEKIGGFTEDYGVGHEDWEFFAKARMLGVQHCLSNRVLFYYRVGAQSMLRGRERIERDLLRNIRAFSEGQSPELYRIALLAQGLTHRWDRPSLRPHSSARPGLPVANRLAFGRVTVIMRTKDRPILLQRAIDSVLGQTFSDWALVIVNDGGDPAPVRALLDARERHLQGRALLINNPASTGMENASNAGITNSSSEFVVVHDDDDAWDPRFLERCVSHLDAASPEVGGVVTNATVIVEDIEGDEVIERNRFLFKNMESVDISKLSVENQFPPISFLFRRSAMEAVGLFDGELPVLGDWDFHLRVALSYRLDVIREPLAYYHHRTAGTTNQYGNTVVAERDAHRIQRSHYINRHLRTAVSQEGAVGEGQLLYMGELHREVMQSVQDIREHMHWIEKLLEDRGDHMKYIEELISKKL